MAHRGRKIDTVHWTYGSFAFIQAAGTQAANVLSAQHLPETILRIRGEWLTFLDSALAGSELISVAVGFILVPEGTGSTVLWSPITDGDAPWIWWDAAILAYEEYVPDVIHSDGTTYARRTIDSKAMRKVRNTELQCVMENATIGSAASARVLGQARVLTGS